MEYASISASLDITSQTLSLERVVELLQIQETSISRSWRIGDAIGKSAVRHKSNGIAISVAERECSDVEPVVIELLFKLAPHRQSLVRVVAANLLQAEISCVVYFVRAPAGATYQLQCENTD